MSSARIHQIRIDFSVTPEVKRFVYAYLVEAQGRSSLIPAWRDAKRSSSAVSGR